MFYFRTFVVYSLTSVHLYVYINCTWWMCVLVDFFPTALAILTASCVCRLVRLHMIDHDCKCIFVEIVNKQYQGLCPFLLCSPTPPGQLPSFLKPFIHCSSVYKYCKNQLVLLAIWWLLFTLPNVFQLYRAIVSSLMFTYLVQKYVINTLWPLSQNIYFHY